MRVDTAAATSRGTATPAVIVKRPKVRVLHVINSFVSGGAEAMLCNLLLATDRTRFEPSAAALIDDMTVAGPVLRAGIPIAAMGMRPGVPDPLGLARLARHLRRLRPHVVQSWMDHSNLITGLASRLAWRGPVVWGIHHSEHLPGVAKRSTLMTVGACARLSHRLPARIICCSEHGRRAYERAGFAADKLVVIPNGFDLEKFRPDSAARAEVRRELGLAPDTPLVGLVARYDPFKDHATFLRAAAIVARARPDVHFVLCGSGADGGNAELVSRVLTLRLSERCHLLGMRRDVSRVHAALDVATSSSISEAFPLAVGEAMACGVPCAVTDVGDSALIVGPTGRVVPPRDPAALAAALCELLDLPTSDRRRLGESARRRVAQRFSLSAAVGQYETLYRRLAAGSSRGGVHV